MMKGLSPLIAIVILIAITISILSIISTWITTLTKGETTTISNKSTEATECTGSNIEIKAVYINNATNRSLISVRNSGYVNENIVSASLLNKNGKEAANLTAFPISFPRGTLKSIEFNTTAFNTTNATTACSSFSQAIVSTLCTSDEFPETAAETPICS